MTHISPADGEESALILEGLDDVELQNATATELQQLKHHLSTKRQAVLSNRSTDWWKTLRVWGDLLQKKLPRNVENAAGR